MTDNGGTVLTLPSRPQHDHILDNKYNHKFNTMTQGSSLENYIENLFIAVTASLIHLGIS